MRSAAVIAAVGLLGTVFSAPAATAAGSSKTTKASTAGPVTSLPDEFSAMMAARKQGTKVEVANDRTSTSQTFANPNGSLTTDTYAGPEWMKNSSGAWEAIDTTLKANADGTVAPAAAPTGLVLSGAQSGSGAHTLATFTMDGAPVTVSWTGVLPKPTLTGSTATYKNVRPGVDLVVMATGTGYEDNLVVNTKAAAAQVASIDLPVTAKGLSVAGDGSGGLQFKDATGKVVGSEPTPMMWDATVDPATGISKHSVAISTASGVQSKATGREDWTLSPSASFFNAATTQYPVTLDPAVSTLGTSLTAYVQENEPTTTTAGNQDIRLGYGSGTVDRSLLSWNTSALEGATISSATFYAWSWYSASCTADSWSLYTVGSFNSSVTWNTQPTWGALDSSSTSTLGFSSACDDGYISTSATSFFQAAATANEATAYMGLKSASETDTNSYKQMRSQNYTVSTELPYASITYTLPPSAPSNLSLNQSNWSSDSNLYTWQTTPTLYATSTDPDGDSINYQFEILSGSTVVASGSTGNIASGTAASWADPTTLTNGTVYTFEARAADGSTWGPWATSYPFRLVTGQPPAPAGLSCSGYPANAWTAQITGGTTCSWTESFPYMNGYNVTLDGTTNWVSTASASINPGPGLHTLVITPNSASNAWGSPSTYVFGVGTAGVTSPAAGATTSTSLPLIATAPTGNTSVTFKYRLGTSGSFASIPVGAVTNSGSALSSWPVSTSSVSGGVTSPTLTWNLAQTLAADGLVQIEAVFTDTNGDTLTAAPVNATLDRVGTAADFGTTPVGPVTVGLQSGNATLPATDVAISSYGSPLAVSRAFNSVAPSTPSVFGPGWTSSITSGTTSSWASIANDGTYAVLTDSSGNTYTFSGTQGTGTTTYTEQGVASTAGYTLTYSSSAGTYTLTDASGNATTFALAGGAVAYTPTLISTQGSSSSTGFVYDSNSSSSTYGKLLLMVAPDAASTSPSTTACPSPASSSTWTSAGCRGLKFNYSSTNGNVSEIDFVYVNSSGTFENVPVAKYTYDASGRLVSEYDPRLSTPLTSSYSYDETSTDANYGRILTYSPAQSGGNALAPWHFTYDTTSGDVNFGKLLSVSRTHSSANGGATATDTVDYAVGLTTALGGPVTMDPTTVATWGQADDPTSAVAVWNAGHVPSSTPTATDFEYATVDYYDAEGREVNTATYVNGAWAVTTTEYDSYGEVTRQLTAANRATALASPNPAATSTTLDTQNFYACDNFGTMTACTSALQNFSVLTDTYGPAHTANVDGTNETIRTHTANAYDAGAPSSDVNAATSNPYMLITSVVVSASVGSTAPGSATADARTTQNIYGSGADVEGWTIGTPEQIVTDPSGLDIATTYQYNESSTLYGGSALQISQSMPSNTGGVSSGTSSIYYTAGANSDTTCGNQPEWANLLCQTWPFAQPSDTTTIPATTYTYNDYLSIATKTDAYGSTGTRTTTYTYDSADRPLTTTVAVSGTGMGAAVPETQVVYAATTGLPTDTETLTSTGTVATDLNTAYDDFGQSTAYTDATGSVTNYTYNLAGEATARANAVSSDTMTYAPGGQAVTDVDSLAGTFTATYNADGALSTETYPDGTVGTYTIDPTGASTAVTYTNSHWAAPITDTVTTNNAGDWTSQSVLNASYSYSYDNDNRVTGAQDTQAGTCTTRAYTYDLDSNRLSQTTYGPASGGACQSTTTAATETYTHDTVDRLESSTLNGTSATYGYDTQGDVTTTPSADAGGSGDLTAGYYANGLLDTQTQASVTDTYTLDGTLDRYTTEANSSTGVTTTNHYSDDSDSPSWSAASGAWTANVVGLDGSLGAQVTSTGVVTLELPDLHGDIIATVNPASDTAPSATYTYTEFGSAEASVPGTYGYLGSDQRSDGGMGGTVLMGSRVYDPNLGRFLEVDPIFGGSANPYDYVYQNPLTGVDLTGQAGNREGVVVVRSGNRYEFTLYIDQAETKWLSGFLGKAGLITHALGVLFPPIDEVAAPLGFLLEGLHMAIDRIDHADRGIYINTYWYKFSWWFFGTHTTMIPYFLWVGGQ